MGFKTTDVGLEVLLIKNAFPKTIINDLDEVIVEPRTNQYFGTYNCETKKDVQAKVLEWLSRGACKTEPYRTAKSNKAFHKYMQNGINEYLETNFSQEDFEKIYDRLGNSIYHALTLQFIES